MLSVLYLTMEMGTFYLCTHSVYNQPVRKREYPALLLPVTVMIMEFIKRYPQYDDIQPVIYVLYFFFCFLEFKRKTTYFLGRFLLSCVIAASVELIAAKLVFMWRPAGQMQDMQYVWLNLICFLGMLCVYRYRLFVRWSKELFAADYIVRLGLLAVVGLFLVIFYRFYKTDVVDVTVGSILALIILILIFALSRWQRAEYEVQKKNMEIAIRKTYDKAFQDLVESIRMKQHDFNNQLNAIYSMHYTAHSLEELIAKQQKYGNLIEKENAYYKILTAISDSTVAGFVYSRCLQAQKKDISVEIAVHNVIFPQDYCLYDMIEILGILFDNAAEVLLQYEKEQRKATVFMQTEKVQNQQWQTVIRITNVSPQYTKKQLTRLFEKGVSSQGDGRGIGLAKLKQLCQKNGYTLSVDNYKDKEGQYQMQFEIVTTPFTKQ